LEDAQESSWHGSKIWAAEGFTEMWGFSAEFVNSTLLAPHTREKLKRYAKAFYCSTAYNSTKVIIIYIDIKV
jgi:hypothetical protein